jgi:molybdopterin-guanine dinucleotide biosynthesis protein A
LKKPAEKMISKEHKKHSDIARPSYGHYSRKEWGIIGTPCNTIRSLAEVIIKALSPRYKCGYADAKHADENDGSPLNQPTSGIAVEYNNHFSNHQFTFTKEFNQFQFRQIFNDADMILVNGNHFQASSQVVVIDNIKKESLKKRLSQLTNVELILFANDEIEVFDFIKETLPSWNKIPMFKLNETDKIVEFFSNKLQKTKPSLNGLVLAGGKSLRMGYDKGTIAWHGKEQQYYLADLLKNFCSEVYVSCRTDQEKTISNTYQTLADTFTGLGPYGAILSAFREKPDAAWLVVACDLPLLDTETLHYLIANRNPSSIATTFESPYNNLPEPLITIWEPKSYPVLLSFLSQGYTCPGKALRNNDVTILRTTNQLALTNVNTPEDFEKMKLLLEKKFPVSDAT